MSHYVTDCRSLLCEEINYTPAKRTVRECKEEELNSLEREGNLRFSFHPRSDQPSLLSRPTPPTGH